MKLIASEGDKGGVLARHGSSGARKRGSHRRVGGRVPLRMAPWEETRGALADHYDVPTAEVRRSSLTPIAVVSSVLVIGILSERHIHFIWENPVWRPLLELWAVSTSQFLVQWFLSYRDRPVSVTLAQQRALDQLRVVVNVPVYNEDPAILDRALWALVNETRPPDCMDVVDDGSTEDYSAMRPVLGRPAQKRPRAGRLARQPNGGKKAAQAYTFANNPAADIMVTVDSDSALAHNALEEGLKPFVDTRVQSVAGMVLVHNADKNWITRVVEAQQNFLPSGQLRGAIRGGRLSREPRPTRPLPSPVAPRYHAGLSWRDFYGQAGEARR